MTGYRDERYALRERLLILEKDRAKLASELESKLREVEQSEGELEKTSRKLQGKQRSNSFVRTLGWIIGGVAVLGPVCFCLVSVYTGAMIHEEIEVEVESEEGALNGTDDCVVTIKESPWSCAAELSCAGKLLSAAEGECREVHGVSFWQSSPSESFVVVTGIGKGYIRGPDGNVTMSFRPD